LISIRPLLFLLLAASLSTPSLAQSFVFASPNTREHMSDEAALASQDSYEQQNFMAVARYFAARLCAAPEIKSSEGLDGSGAENSLLITGCRGKRAIYLGELLARYGHQRWVLIFDSTAAGLESLFAITLTNLDVHQVLEKMRRHSLRGGTVISSGKNVVVYVWTTDPSAAASVRSFAQGSQGNIQQIPGKGYLLGNQDRALAQRILDRDIAAYERQSKLALSRELWSRKLHDMGLRLTPAKTPSSPARTAPVGHGAPSGRPSAP
jgi:hypothetical protein